MGCLICILHFIYIDLLLKMEDHKAKNVILFTLHHTADIQALGQRKTPDACGLYSSCQLGMENRESRRKSLIFVFPLIYHKQNTRNQLHIEKINPS